MELCITTTEQRMRLLQCRFVDHCTNLPNSFRRRPAHMHVLRCTLTLTPLAMQVTGLTSGVSKVICGDYFSCAISTAGALSCWGSNAYGQLGDGTFVDKLVPTPVSGMTTGVLSASAGSAHVCAIKSGGALYCWGSNLLATLGNGKCCNAPSNTPVQVTLNTLGGPNTATVVAAGAGHTCAVRTTGGTFCWGR